MRTSASRKPKAKNRWIQRGIKRPGRIQRAAKRAGVSVTEEARRMARSEDKSAAAAGRLALRFKGKAGRGNIRRKKRATSRTK